ncbi:MAG: Trm112 family protein [Nitrospirales bacterium]
MGENQPTPGHVNIDQELLSILCCPETKQDVTLADGALISRVNERIAKGEMKNKAGQTVTDKLDGGLLRADKKILYPIRDDIPVMLIEEGLPVEGLV